MRETRHFSEERQFRDNLIKNVIGDTNNVLCSNVIDRGHKDGPERFELTDKAIIKVYNNETNRHITDFVERQKQLYDRMGDAFRALDIKDQRKLLDLARVHQIMGYNEV